jgi:hypothetical protein
MTKNMWSKFVISASITFLVITVASCGGGSSPPSISPTSEAAPQLATKSTCNIDLASFTKISQSNLSKQEINTILGCEGEISIDVPTRVTSAIVDLDPPTYFHVWKGPTNADGTPSGSIAFAGPVPDTKENYYRDLGEFSYVPRNKKNTCAVPTTKRNYFYDSMTISQVNEFVGCIGTTIKYTSSAKADFQEHVVWGSDSPLQISFAENLSIGDARNRSSNSYVPSNFCEIDPQKILTLNISQTLEQMNKTLGCNATILPRSTLGAARSLVQAVWSDSNLNMVFAVFEGDQAGARYLQTPRVQQLPCYQQSASWRAISGQENLLQLEADLRCKGRFKNFYIDKNGDQFHSWEIQFNQTLNYKNGQFLSKEQWDYKGSTGAQTCKISSTLEDLKMLRIGLSRIAAESIIGCSGHILELTNYASGESYEQSNWSGNTGSKQNRIDYLEIIFVNDLLISAKAGYPEDPSFYSNCSPSALGFAAVSAGDSYAVAAKKIGCDIALTESVVDSTGQVNRYVWYDAISRKSYVLIMKDGVVPRIGYF